MRRSDLLPPAVTRALLRGLGRATLRGDYSNWESALAASAPYETDLSVYARLTEEIRAGRSTSSRLLSPLLSAILLAGGMARVLDFGGNLGEVYFDACRLAGRHIESWNVVDLPEIALLGNSRFADDKLRFFSTIEDALARQTPNVVLCFHVLQYLQSPFQYLSRLVALAPSLIVLNEFPVGNRERIMVQHLLPELGGGRRPVRIFSDEQIAAALADWELIEEIGLPPWDRTLVGARHVSRIYRRRAG
ncbi:MAG: methyltransferase, TIGR04325 family [Proteobacteria bacterium]|nr:methyltransferase, TIGR04325 family [Pseudomonadota bacterium]